MYHRRKGKVGKGTICKGNDRKGGKAWKRGVGNRRSFAAKGAKEQRK